MTSSTCGPLLRRALALGAAARWHSVPRSRPCRLTLPRKARRRQPRRPAARRVAVPGPWIRPGVRSAGHRPLRRPAPQRPELSGEGLAEAVRRDLGMTVAEFNAAGEQGKRAAAALPRLRKAAGFEAMQPGRGQNPGRRCRARTSKQLAPCAHSTQADALYSRQEFVLAPSEAPAAAAPSSQSSPLPASADSSPDPACRRAGQSADAGSSGHKRGAALPGVPPGGGTGRASGRGRGGRQVHHPDGRCEPARAEPQPGDRCRHRRSGCRPSAGSARRSRSMSPSEFVAQYANVVLENGRAPGPGGGLPRRTGVPDRRRGGLFRRVQRLQPGRASPWSSRPATALTTAPRGSPR